MGKNEEEKREEKRLLLLKTVLSSDYVQAHLQHCRTTAEQKKKKKKKQTIRPPKPTNKNQQQKPKKQQRRQKVSLCKQKRHHTPTLSGTRLRRDRSSYRQCPGTNLSLTHQRQADSSRPPKKQQKTNTLHNCSELRHLCIFYFFSQK